MDSNSEVPIQDILRQMCIQQGYIPSTCTLSGQIVWLLINNGKDPCAECNMDRTVCKGRSKKE
jgi:hypothetical protein